MANIPLYGQNKDGGVLGDFADFLNGALKMVDNQYYALAGNASDVTLATGGSEGINVLGATVIVTNMTSVAGDFQANVKVNAVEGTHTTAGQEMTVHCGGGFVANSETILLELTGTSTDSADVRVIVWGAAAVDSA